MGAGADLWSGFHGDAKPFYGKGPLGIRYVGWNGAGFGDRDVHVSRALRSGTEFVVQAPLCEDDEVQVEGKIGKFAAGILAQREAMGKLRKRTSDFPMMTEGIDDASDAPVMFVTDRIHLRSAGS